MRLRTSDGYFLRRILAVRLPPLPEPGGGDTADDAMAWPLTVEAEMLRLGAAPAVRVLATAVSDADPFHDPAAYDAAGRRELEQLRAELVALGLPPGMPLGATAAAVWRRHVARTWARDGLLETLGLR